MPAKKTNEFGLTELRERFCNEYLKHLNGTQAYLDAGYSASRDVARREAYKLLTMPVIQARLEQLKQEQADRTRITADRVLEEIGRVAFSSMGDFAEWDGSRVSLKDSQVLPAEKLAAVASARMTVTQGGGGSVSIKLHNKLEALNMLCRHYGLYNDKLTVEGKVVYVIEDVKKEPPCD